MPSKFYFDRSVFRATRADDPELQRNDYASLTPEERLEIAYFLNAQAYNFPLDECPRMDKQFFKLKTRK